ncbi:hypothetical protein EES47_24555 [Streptomyces sp. ADI98-12]|nr:hypothetical protein EES47_24555 [Streptomyces sp. ADI98-12]
MARPRARPGDRRHRGGAPRARRRRRGGAETASARWSQQGASPQPAVPASGQGLCAQVRRWRAAGPRPSPIAAPTRRGRADDHQVQGPRRRRPAGWPTADLGPRARARRQGLSPAPRRPASRSTCSAAEAGRTPRSSVPRGYRGGAALLSQATVAGLGRRRPAPTTSSRCLRDTSPSTWCPPGGRGGPPGRASRPRTKPSQAAEVGDFPWSRGPARPRDHSARPGRPAHVGGHVQPLRVPDPVQRTRPRALRGRGGSCGAGSGSPS